MPLIVSICVGLSLMCAAARSAPPNIVLFLIDDLGWKDIGCQGSNYYKTD